MEGRLCMEGCLCGVMVVCRGMSVWRDGCVGRLCVWCDGSV